MSDNEDHKAEFKDRPEKLLTPVYLEQLPGGECYVSFRVPWHDKELHWRLVNAIVETCSTEVLH